MHFACRVFPLLLVWVACTDRPSLTDGDTDTSKDPTTTMSVPTEPGETPLDTMMVPGGPPTQCGPPCDETWTFVGDLELGDLNFSSTDQFRCMTRIVGSLGIYDLDQDQLSGLQNLVSIEGGLAILSETLTDLSPFACLEEVTSQIQLGNAENLTDVTGFSALRFTPLFRLWYTGVSALPTFSPEFAGLAQLEIKGNHSLVDLDGMATWKPDPENVWAIVSDNERLTSVAGLNGLLTGGSESSSVWLEFLPALSSLDGLEGAAELYSVDLGFLPLVEDLTPLAQLERVDRLSLASMPLVQDLQGLDQLTTAGTLIIGGCWTSAPYTGMEGLTSLAGLSSLTSVGAFGIQGNEHLVTLAGADQLTVIGERWAVEDNPVLEFAAIDAFAAQVGKDRCDPSFDPECACYELAEDSF